MPGLEIDEDAGLDMNHRRPRTLIFTAGTSTAIAPHIPIPASGRPCGRQQKGTELDKRMQQQIYMIYTSIGKFATHVFFLKEGIEIFTGLGALKYCHV